MRILATLATFVLTVLMLPLSPSSANAAECLDERGCPHLINFTQTGLIDYQEPPGVASGFVWALYDAPRGLQRVIVTVHHDPMILLSDPTSVWVGGELLPADKVVVAPNHLDLTIDLSDVNVAVGEFEFSYGASISPAAVPGTTLVSTSEVAWSFSDVGDLTTDEGSNYLIPIVESRLDVSSPSYETTVQRGGSEPVQVQMSSNLGEVPVVTTLSLPIGFAFTRPEIRLGSGASVPCDVVSARVLRCSLDSVDFVVGVQANPALPVGTAGSLLIDAATAEGYPVALSAQGVFPLRVIAAAPQTSSPAPPSSPSAATSPTTQPPLAGSAGPPVISIARTGPRVDGLGAIGFALIGGGALLLLAGRPRVG